MRFISVSTGIDHRIDAVALRGASAPVDENAIVARAIESLIPHIHERAQSAVTAIPVPKSVTIDDVRPLIEAEVARAVERLKPQSQASRSLQAMRIDVNGELIVEMSDGYSERLGTFVSRYADEFSYEQSITSGVRALPAPRGLAP